MLKFTATVYHLNGTLKGIENLEGSDFNLCPGLNHEKNKALRFGINYQYNCEIDAQQFLNNLKTEFIVPYLQYSDDNKLFLHAIPIMIKNINVSIIWE